MIPTADQFLALLSISPVTIEQVISVFSCTSSDVFKMLEILWRSHNVSLVDGTIYLSPPNPKFWIPRPKECNGVYIIRSLKLNLYKIGYSSDVNTRFCVIKTHNADVLELILVFAEGTKELESSLHERFSDRRVRGEWFDLTKKDLEILLDEYMEWVPLDTTGGTDDQS